MNDLISRKALLAEYDRVHIGPPGGARKLIEDAPREDAVDLPIWATETAYKNGYEQGKKDALKPIGNDRVREKLIEILRVPIYPHLDADPTEVVADYLLDNGVTFATENNVGDKLTPTGCEYCQEDAEGYRRMIGAFSITNPFHGKVWKIETCHCKPRQIFFCPMCGRKLSEPPKVE